MPDDPMTLSYSRLSRMQGCPASFKYHYEDQIPPGDRVPQGPLIAGKIGHAVIEESENLGLWKRVAEGKPDVLVKMFEEEFRRQIDMVGGPDKMRWGGRKSTNFPDGEDMQWWIRFGAPKTLGHYVEVRLADEGLGWHMVPGGVERRITTTLPDGTSLVTILDAFLMVTADGEPVVRDYKFGQTSKANKRQLATYSWAVQQDMGVIPTMQFVYLRSNDPFKRVQAHDVSYLIEAVPSWFLWLKHQIESGDRPFLPEADWTCRGCEFREICPVGSKIAGEIVFND